MTADKRPDHDVDDLRRRLLALGYLDAGVDRFVLAPVREGRTRLRNAMRASARIGLLAGIVLGPAAAVGVAVRAPGLVTNLRDAIVLALYLGVSFGVATALAALAVALIAGGFVSKWPGLLARHADPLARTLGALIAVLCLVYLTLWWNAAGTIDAPPTLLWSVGALFVAVAVSALLFRLVATSTLALLAQTQTDAPLVPRARASRRMAIVTATLAFAGSFVLLWSVSTAGQSTVSATSASPLVVVPTGWRVVVVAIDGFDRQLAGRALDPASPFARMIAGASTEIVLPDDRDPARIWTSVATGFPADEHGVTALEGRQVAGLEGRLPGASSGPPATLTAALDLIRLTRPTINSGVSRRARTFWEVAAVAGLRSAVVNWWATWPASEDEGIVFTDRATLRLERGGALDGEFAPATIYPTLQSAWPDTRMAINRFTERHTHELPDGTREVVRRALEVDAGAQALALTPPLRDVDLLAIYLPGLDIVQTTLLDQQHARGHDVAALVEHVDTVERYYRTLDQLVAPLVEPAADRLVVIIGLPGRLDSSTPAIFAVAGDHVVHRATSVARLEDIAPTVLYALGLPLSEELEGQPLTALFEQTFVERHAVRRVPTFGRRQAALGARGDQRLDREARERLRSLGYVR